MTSNLSQGTLTDVNIASWAVGRYDTFAEHPSKLVLPVQRTVPTTLVFLSQYKVWYPKPSKGTIGIAATKDSNRETVNISSVVKSSRCSIIAFEWVWETQYPYVQPCGLKQSSHISLYMVFINIRCTANHTNDRSFCSIHSLVITTTSPLNSMFLLPTAPGVEQTFRGHYTLGICVRLNRDDT